MIIIRPAGVGEIMSYALSLSSASFRWPELTSEPGPDRETAPESEPAIDHENGTVLYYTLLYFTILYYTIPYYTILYYTVLYHTVLHYTVLYYTVGCLFYLHLFIWIHAFVCLCIRMYILYICISNYTFSSLNYFNSCWL